MKETTIAAQARELSTKHHLKAMRAQGQIPAVFYGHNETSATIAVDAKEFDRLIHSGAVTGIINLKLDGGTKQVIVKDVQRDIMSQAPIHIDFQAVSMKEKVELEVPVHLEGTAPGVKLQGGTLEHITREVTVRCLPADIPEAITVDISSLGLNQAVAVKDLPVIKGVEIMLEPDTIIVNILGPRGAEAAPAGAAEAAATTASVEPEVMSKGKKETEGGAEKK